MQTVIYQGYGLDLQELRKAVNLNTLEEKIELLEEKLYKDDIFDLGTKTVNGPEYKISVNYAQNTTDFSTLLLIDNICPVYPDGKDQFLPILSRSQANQLFTDLLLKLMELNNTHIFDDLLKHAIEKCADFVDDSRWEDLTVNKKYRKI